MSPCQNYVTMLDPMSFCFHRRTSIRHIDPSHSNGAAEVEFWTTLDVAFTEMDSGGDAPDLQVGVNDWVLDLNSLSIKQCASVVRVRISAVARSTLAKSTFIKLALPCAPL